MGRVDVDRSRCTGRKPRKTINVSAVLYEIGTAPSQELQAVSELRRNSRIPKRAGRGGCGFGEPLLRGCYVNLPRLSGSPPLPQDAEFTVALRESTVCDAEKNPATWPWK